MFEDALFLTYQKKNDKKQPQNKPENGTTASCINLLLKMSSIRQFYREKYAFNPVTLSFNDPSLRAEYNISLNRKEINRTALRLLVIYNCLSAPLFFYFNSYLDSKLIDGYYGFIGQLFLFTIYLVHALFFLIYCVEMGLERWPFLYHHIGGEGEHEHEEYKRKTIQAIRTTLILGYALLSPCGIGLALNVKARNLCTHVQISMKEVGVPPSIHLSALLDILFTLSYHSICPFFTHCFATFTYVLSGLSPLPCPPPLSFSSFVTHPHSGVHLFGG